MARLKFDRSLIPAAPDLQFETALWAGGARSVAGVDEAGRGALAGPVAAGAVILPAMPEVQASLAGVRDSKEMTPAERGRLAQRIREVALAYAIGFASPQEIDRLGIVPATRLAIARALQALPTPADHLLVDFLALPEIPLPQTSLIKGDARSLSIAAASVLAKTTRDTAMRKLDREYPAYGFAAHKGYATAEHRRALAELGPCPFHRMSFAPCAASKT